MILIDNAGRVDVSSWGGILTHAWDDTRTDAQGRYRLYVESDAYEFQVKAPGVGVARLEKTPINNGDEIRLGRVVLKFQTA